MRKILAACAVLLVVLAVGNAAAAGSQEESSASGAMLAYVPQVGFAGESSCANYEAATKAAEELGYEMQMGDPNFDGARQVQIMEDFIAVGAVDGVVLQPIDARLAVAAVEKANENGIPVVVFDTGLVDGDVVAVVRVDHADEGVLAAKYAVEALTEKYGEPKGKILEVAGPLTDPSSQGRGRGFHEYIDKYTDIEVVLKPCDWIIPTAESTVRDFLTSHPDTDVVFSHSDYYSEGIASGMQQVDRYHKAGSDDHVIWVSIDAMPCGVEKVKEGYMDGTSNGNFDIHAGLAVQLLDKFIKAGERPAVGSVIEEAGALWSPARVMDFDGITHVVTTSLFITAENVDNEKIWGNKQYDVR